MRREIFRMERAEAEELLGRAEVVHMASTTAEGAPLLRAVHGVVVRGSIAFHGAPAGEKIEAVGRAAVVSCEQIVASIPSYFTDPARACPATTLYRSAQAHGVIERVDDPEHKAEVLEALMRKYQPEGGYAPLDARSPLYRKAIEGILVLAVPLERLDGKAKLAQNRAPEERARLLAKLWERGSPGDPGAIELLRGACPDTPVPDFLRAPAGCALACALGPRDVDAAVDLLEGAYWNQGVPREVIALAQLGSSAWVGARDAAGRLVATARAVSDGSKRAWMFDVMVAPPLRGLGVGEAVVRLLLAHPAVRGARHVHLGTQDAHTFYARFGFRHRADLPPPPFTSTEMVLARG
ncbi:GNAT family N-acetyltransferase [Sorangium sp. So ce834]|uniref:GNAT family N-acetyltransferase n=1 Tax=Sorangium sp. So ce834 TaxID=3133321 RepID=UPI003F630827